MKNILISIKITLAFCVLLFVGYVLVLWGVAAVTQPNAGRVEGMMLNGNVVGAVQVGQQFSNAKYFWSRPSAVDYNGSASGGSNKGPTNADYLKEVSVRIDRFCAAHSYLEPADVPAEMVTASGSGLDPHISLEGAMVQAQRIADARGVTRDQIIEVIETQKEKPLFGPSCINVLKLNIALDENQNN